MRRPRSEPHGILVMLVCACLAACSSGEQDAAGKPDASLPAGAVAPAPDSETMAAPTRPVIAEALPYGEVDDQLVYGHFAIPADMIDPLPAIIVIHDWWGLNPEMRQTAERFAAEGYIVLGIDLFAGQTASGPAEARVLELEVFQNPGTAMENIRQAYDFIRNTAGAPQIATVGFGFGGGWSLNAAIDLSGQLDTCVSFYGQVLDDKEKLAPITAPFLGLYADGDRSVPVSSVESFQSALQSMNKDVTVHIYPDARRGFADTLSDNFDGRIAEDAWGRTLKFLGASMETTAR